MAWLTSWRARLVLLILPPLTSTLHAQGVATKSLASGGSERPYRVNDWFEREEIEGVTFSPDGQAVAFTRRRPASSQLTHALVAPETRSDVWMQEAAGRPARNLTQGQADSSGWWAPQWSADGQWLAMLSSRGGNVSLWGWERARNHLRQLSREGLDFDEGGGCRWIDARRLLCVAMDKGVPSPPLSRNGLLGGEGPALAEALWAKTRRGERSVSAVSSLEFQLPVRRLLLVDLATGGERSMAPVQVDRWSEGGGSFQPSPGAPVIAVVRPQPAAFQVMLRSIMGSPEAVELRSLDGRLVPLDRPLPANVLTSTMRWSPDGKSLAFFALGDALIHPELLYREAASEVVYPRVASKEYPGRLWRVELSRGRVVPWSTGDIDLGREAKPPAFTWTAAGELLFRAPRLTNGARPVVPSPVEWLLLERDGRTRSLLNAARTVPDALEPIEGGSAFLGLADGNLWRVDAAKGTLKDLTAQVGSPVLQFSVVEDAKHRAHVIVSASTPRAARDSEWVDLRLPLAFAKHYVLEPGGRVIPLPKPAPQAKLAAFAAETKSAVYREEDRTGTFLWRTSPGGRKEQLASANASWKDIVQPEQRIIEYTSHNGEYMKAKLTLPLGYQPGQRVPLVVDSDIGTSATDDPHAFELSSTEPLLWPVEELYAAAGYAYMFTSWPTTGMDPAGRANLLLGPNGVLPAVDEVIRQGVADPDRLFLYGMSSMGYGVYGLVTQTNRFRAAVADVGWVDQTSNFLGVAPFRRYTDNPFDFNRIGALYSRFWLPVWRNADHLRRNSPLSYVDRVQTPLMLVGGDMDYTGDGLTQPELFFSALVQQRKPAEFVRYWGEGHHKQTPANFRDYWQRIFAWFDRWGDISRDADGDLVYSGGRVKSRDGAPALQPEDYDKFPPFGPGGTATQAAHMVPDTITASHR